MAKFRSKPSIVDAVRWQPENKDFIVQNGEINTPFGWKIINSGDWIISTGFGEMFVMSDDIFRLKYEPISDEARIMLNNNDGGNHENN